MRSRWLLVLCVALSVAGIAVAIAALRGSEYTAESLVKVQDLGERGRQGISRERLQEVRQVVGNEKVSRTAMNDSGWTGNLEEFGQRLDVQTTNGSGLEVVFSADTPGMAAAGANAYASSFVERVERLDENRLAGGSLNAWAEVSRAASPPRLRRAVDWLL